MSQKVLHHHTWMDGWMDEQLDGKTVLSSGAGRIFGAWGK
jgi:hypothetical protein